MEQPIPTRISHNIVHIRFRFGEETGRARSGPVRRHRAGALVEHPGDDDGLLEAVMMVYIRWRRRNEFIQDMLDTVTPMGI